MRNKIEKRFSDNRFNWVVENCTAEDIFKGHNNVFMSNRESMKNNIILDKCHFPFQSFIKFTWIDQKIVIFIERTKGVFSTSFLFNLKILSLLTTSENFFQFLSTFYSI